MSVLAFDLLGGGALTGKFNRAKGPGEATRAGRISEAQRAAAEVVMGVAEAVGRSPAQVAINWATRRAPNVIPILGARRPGQLDDNLGALAFELPAEQMDALNAIAPLPRHYPHTFWNDHTRGLIYGPAVGRLRTDRWP
jgi:aryl-alcohol dehydrogenase-like predicted oxidoreductase